MTPKPLKEQQSGRAYRLPRFGRRTDRWILFVALLGLPLLRFIWILTGIDRLTTISLWRVTTVASALGYCGLLVFVCVRGLWLPYVARNANGPHYYRWRDRPAVKYLQGAACIVTCSLWGTLFFVMNLGVLAQHLAGAETMIGGVVGEIYPNYSPRNPCSARMKLIADSQNGSLSFCVGTAFSEAVGPMDLEKGDRVQLTLRRTVLGSVVVGVQRIV